MSILIHHGANGSYKTAGVVQDHLIPAIKSGRVVVTNIRGVSLENNTKVFGHDVHIDHDVIYVDTETKKGREKIACFWHWAPLGALLLFDEAGVLFPKRWRDKDLQKLDFDNAEEQGRPFTWVEAWEMHRHYNWDIVLSCPNIKGIRDDIRQTSEGACKHRNNAIIGLSGSYNEGFHSAQENGSNPSQFLSVRKRKINERTFKLYKSTKTGKTQDTTAGTSLFHNGKLMVALGVAFFTIGYSIYNWVFNNPFQKTSNESVQLVSKVDNVDSEPLIIKAVHIPNDNVRNVKLNKNYSVEPFAGFEISIKAYLSSKDKFMYYFNLENNGFTFQASSDEMIKAGYSVVRITQCSATLIYKAQRTNLHCKGKNKKLRV